MSSQSIITSKGSNPNKKAISSQTIFKYINIIVTLILLFCIKGFLSFRELCQEKGYYVISMDSIVWTLVGFMGIFIVKYSWFYFGRNWIQSLVDPKYEGQERVYKTRATLKLSFDSIFYALVTIFAYVLFRDQYWFPTMVGGCGSCAQIYKQYPNWPLDSRNKLETYFMIQLGIHSFSLFQMVVLKRKTERKFYEYVLHHSVAVSLILFSTLSNQIVAGAMILIIHDASDIFMAFFRCYIEIKNHNKIIAIVCYLMTAGCWIWMRIVVYPFCLLAQVFANKPTSQDMWLMIQFEYGYLLTMAFVLFGMHLFWTYLILKVGLRSATKKVGLQNIHDKKVKQ